MNLIGQGLDLHKACHVRVLLEPNNSLGVTRQMIFRTLRLGQTSSVVIYALILDNTFDEKRLCRASTKYLPHVLGSTLNNRAKRSAKNITQNNEGTIEVALHSNA